MIHQVAATREDERRLVQDAGPEELDPVVGIGIPVGGGQEAGEEAQRHLEPPVEDREGDEEAKPDPKESPAGGAAFADRFLHRRREHTEPAAQGPEGPRPPEGEGLCNPLVGKKLQRHRERNVTGANKSSMGIVLRA